MAFRLLFSEMLMRSYKLENPPPQEKIANVEHGMKVLREFLDESGVVWPADWRTMSVDEAGTILQNQSHSRSDDGISGEIRASMQARFAKIEWSVTTLTIMSGYRLRWKQAAHGDDPAEMGRIVVELWDRLVMYPDDAHTRLGLAHVGVEFAVSMQVNSRLSGVPLPEVCESLSGNFYEIREGRRVDFAITNAAGERRTLTFEGGERTVTLPGGAPIPSN